jgi:carbon-monoxide dehydrogenase medium subunit
MLSADELLIAIELPAARQKSAHFFHEFSRRHGDYALAGIAAQALIEDGIFSDLRLAFFAIGDRPVLAEAANTLIGAPVTPERLSEVVALLAGELDPHTDQQATTEMRRHLAGVLLRRCVSTLLDRPELSAIGRAA